MVIFGRNRAKFGGGGGIFCTGYSNVTVKASFLYFYGNKALPGSSGGAIFLESSSLFSQVNKNNNILFSNNTADNGGAIYLSGRVRAAITLASSCQFKGNQASSSGGAIYSLAGKVAFLTFAKFFSNQARQLGGALFLRNSEFSIKGRYASFTKNSAQEGGGIYSREGSLVLSSVNFMENKAEKRGGGVFVFGATYRTDYYFEALSIYFQRNSAKECGGALYAEFGLYSFTQTVIARGNSGSAFCMFESHIQFGVFTKFENNTGKVGGAIALTSRSSFISFNGDTVFDSNSASIGGAIYSLQESALTFKERTSFRHNSASTDGGAIFASGTRVVFKDIVRFEHNTASNGGALYLKNLAILTFGIHCKVYSSQNSVSHYGGVLYIEDNANPAQCAFKDSTILTMGAISTGLPYCFIELEQDLPIKAPHYRIDNKVHSSKDVASKDGSFLYGGLLGRCQLIIESFKYRLKTIVVYNVLKSNLFDVEGSDNATLKITSKPYQLCFCEDGEYNCSSDRIVTVYSGQKFNISLAAIDQTGSVISTQVTAKTRQTARLKLAQSVQTLPAICSNLSYNLYSTQSSEHLKLYPDGPCRDTGLAQAVVDVKILPCPRGFNKSNEKCVCEQRLERIGANCTIDDNATLTKGAEAEFWVCSLRKNHSYQGLILYKTCPIDYCKEGTVNILLDDPDDQCANHRTGLLCGGCAGNYSLMLGSSRCGECSHAYLALLLPFAAAGIALVVFLSVLRLTVATGMINSIILYANIVQANRELFLPKRNALTLFIAWFNLDFGIETCFYQGMTAYAKTWLQFVFPIYIWILMSFIIVMSRYSIIVSRLIGHNPIAVLATLLLMSYTKILKIIIDVFSSVTLEYPNDEFVPSWLKDANVSYLKSGHLLLSVVATLVLAFFFLPYTFLLLAGFKLYPYFAKKRVHWLHRLKPLLDSYYAPYRPHTRYWTGFLLLVRCALYVFFSFNSLGATQRSLLAISIAFTALLTTAWFPIRVYRSSFNNYVEASVYVNLVVLSATKSTGTGSEALVYSLVGMVLVTAVVIVMYHFHMQFTAKFATWEKLKTNISSAALKLKGSRACLQRVQEAMPGTPSSGDPHRIVTRTVIELREPLLEGSEL